MVERKTIEAAVEGDRDSAGLIIEAIKDKIYNLSVKMLLFPEDAEDATQEILLKVLTRLSQFRFESSFETWVYRVSVNSLLTYRGKLSSKFETSFDEYEVLIDSGQTESVPFVTSEQEMSLLAEEVKVSCTHGLLLCLSPRSRAIYVLGEILEFDSKEGASLVGGTPEAFRKSLSRSKTKLKHFLSKKCGIVNQSNPCRCERKIDFLSKNELTDPRKFRFANQTKDSKALLEKISEAERLARIYRGVPEFEYPGKPLEKLLEILEVGE